MPSDWVRAQRLLFRTRALLHMLETHDPVDKNGNARKITGRVCRNDRVAPSQHKPVPIVAGPRVMRMVEFPGS
ncbi:unnamed protein product [Ixodes persulcatus]